MPPRPFVDELYAKVANEEDARACTDISDQACQVVPGNFFKIIVANMLTQIGDLLTSPKTVLAWLVVAVGAPSSLVGLLVPIRESLSMLPQLLIGAWMRRYPVRKGFWVLGAVLQGVSMMAMALAVWLLQGWPAGLAILALLALFSISRGFCSVAMKDVQGKCIPKARRGRQTGLVTTLAGVVTLLLSLVLFRGDQDPSVLFDALLLIGAGVAWLLAALIFQSVDEYKGASEGGGNAFKTAMASLSLILTDPPFRHFVITRALLMASALAAPFLVVIAQSNGGLPLLLGSFVIASSLASTLSATIWGYMADSSSRNVMLRGGALAAAVCLISGLAAVLLSDLPLQWFYPLAFFLLSVAHAGVRIGRKTYLVDMAGGTKRTDYTAVSNTLMGALLLLLGGASALVAILGAQWALLFLGTLGAAGAFSAWRLAEA